MLKLIAPIFAALALVLAAPAFAAGDCGGFTTQSVEADGPISSPVDTASTPKPDSSS